MKNKFQYILDTFETVYQLGEFRPLINYGFDGESPIQIRQGSSGFFQKRQVLHHTRLVWKKWLDVEIPFLFDHEETEIFSRVDGRTIINYDIIAASFFFLSGWQEYTCQRKDRFGRFPYSESLQHKTDLAAVPIVNYYFDILKSAIERRFEVCLKRKLWPEATFVTCVTHDIDKCQSAWREGSLAEIRKGNLLSPIKLISERIFQRDAWFNFSEMLRIEQRLNVHASYYFLGRSSKSFGVANADYDIQSPRMREVLQEVKAAGAEIGLHGSYGTHRDDSRLSADLNRLDSAVVGNRFHFLAFDVATTPRVLEQTGMRYDTSLGFSEHYGFRNGFCFPFLLYDIGKDQPTSVWEIPLNLMDTTLHHHWYLNLAPAEVITEVQKLVNEIKKFGGCFTVLWHNTHFSRYKYPGWQEVFVDILKLARREGSSFLRAKDVLLNCTCAKQDGVTI